VDAVIDERGRVQDVRVVQGVGMGLNESAVEAFRQWRFRPAYRDGNAVPTPVSMTFEFQLKDR
jgi:protein TonB